eukprot:scaffold5985_cov18-Tisochrysis_lutea.AAC.1
MESATMSYAEPLTIITLAQKNPGQQNQAQGAKNGRCSPVAGSVPTRPGWALMPGTATGSNCNQCPQRSRAKRTCVRSARCSYVLTKRTEGTQIEMSLPGPAVIGLDS